MENLWSSDPEETLTVDAARDREVVVRRVKERLIADRGFDAEVMERTLWKGAN